MRIFLTTFREIPKTSERDPYVLTKLAHSSKANVTLIVNFTGKVLLTVRRCQVALNNPNENEIWWRTFRPFKWLSPSLCKSIVHWFRSTSQLCRYTICFVKHFSKLCALLTLSSLAILVDSSRVFLSSSEPEKNYINASFVDVSKWIVIFYSQEVYSTHDVGCYIPPIYHFYCRWF